MTKLDLALHLHEVLISTDLHDAHFVVPALRDTVRAMRGYLDGSCGLDGTAKKLTKMRRAALVHDAKESGE